MFTVIWLGKWVSRLEFTCDMYANDNVDTTKLVSRQLVVILEQGINKRTLKSVLRYFYKNSSFRCIFWEPFLVWFISVP